MQRLSALALEEAASFGASSCVGPRCRPCAAPRSKKRVLRGGWVPNQDSPPALRTVQGLSGLACPGRYWHTRQLRSCEVAKLRSCEVAKLRSRARAGGLCLLSGLSLLRPLDAREELESSDAGVLAELWLRCAGTAFARQAGVRDCCNSSSWAMVSSWARLSTCPEEARSCGG